MFYTLIKQVFDQSERAQGSIYIIILAMALSLKGTDTSFIQIDNYDKKKRYLQTGVLGIVSLFQLPFRPRRPFIESPGN